MSSKAATKSTRATVRAKPQTRIVEKHNRHLLTYKEAIGKTVEAIQHSRDDKEGVWTLEIRFTDKTAFFFDIDARPRVRAQYKMDKGGDLELLHQYARKTVCDW